MRQKVYVITSDGPTKVGISSNPALRCRTLKRDLRDSTLSLAHVADVAGRKASDVEKKVHELLGEVRVHGEWFDVEARQAIEAIDAALETVRDVRSLDQTPDMVHWHLRITIDSSTKDQVEHLARRARRSVVSYVAGLILKDIQEKDGSP